MKALKTYKCADCPKPIEPGDQYVAVSEYGETRKLHFACYEKRNLQKTTNPTRAEAPPG